MLTSIRFCRPALGRLPHFHGNSLAGLKPGVIHPGNQVTLRTQPQLAQRKIFHGDVDGLHLSPTFWTTLVSQYEAEASHLDAPNQHQNHHDHQNGSQPSARIVAQIPAVWPDRKSVVEGTSV